MALSNRSCTFNDITLERAGTNNPYTVVKDTTSISLLFVPLCFVERRVTSEVYLKILKEVLMRVLKEEGRNNMPFHQDGGSSL
jgi:hypothetical protein